MELTVLSREGGVSNLVGPRGQWGERQSPFARTVAELASLNNTIACVIANHDRRSRLVEILAEFGNEYIGRTGDHLVGTWARRNKLGVGKRG